MSDLAKMNFNPANVEDMGEAFQIVPPGIYQVLMIKSQLTETKNGNGQMLVCEYQIIEGPSIGSTLIDRLNVKNPSEVAQKIALSQLKNICDAVGVTGQLTDSAQLHGKSFAVKVDVEEFESNKDGKMLKANRIVKRMAKKEVPMNLEPAGTANQASTW